MTYHQFLIGRRWANQYGKGVTTATLFSSTNPPTGLPKGYTVYRKFGTVKIAGAKKFPFRAPR